MFKLKEEDVCIHLVDDDKLHLKVLQSKFETSTNYQLRTYTSGEEFLENIIKNPIPKRCYPIVILDYLLKTRENYARDGIEILKDIKKLNPDIEVIMLSVVDDRDVADSALESGAVTFIKKNENSFIRIQSYIKKIISEKNLKRMHRHSRFTIKIFLSILLIVIILIGIIYFLFPEIINL